MIALDANPFFGVGLHALGGLAAGSFYIPFRQVRNWAWESYWLVGGFFSWIIAPWLIALLTVPGLLDILANAPMGSIAWSYLFGVLWGIGGLTFGLSMRYLGMSLGYALALGCCAAFGTLIPPAFTLGLGVFVESASGWLTLAGVFVCLGGITICGLAGIRKEREISPEAKAAAVREFNFPKGVLVALFAGVMSACMAFGIAAGKPIATLAVEHDVPPLWQNGPVFIIILAGGFTTNCIWCLILNTRNRTGGDYANAATPLLRNYVFSALAGVTWYMQFMFYGMGTTQMGEHDYASWTIHMAFIIVFSNIWGIIFREWKGTSRRTHHLIFGGIAVLIASTLVVGAANYLGSIGR